MKRKTHREFVDEVAMINPEVKITGTYVNNSTKIDVVCLKCTTVWQTIPSSLTRGHGCPVCAKNKRKSHGQFVLEMREINPYIEIKGTYQKAITPIAVKCTICGCEWSSTPNRLLNGTQCPKCTKPHTSFMEQFMLIALQYALGNDMVDSRNTSAIGLELDIYVPKYKLAIEPGTWLYHKKKVQSLDLDKRLKCKKAGIRLITVYDTYPQGEIPPFESDCYVFSGFLNEPGYRRMIELLESIMHSYDIECNGLDWTRIANEAYASCHYDAHDSFVRLLAGKYPDIEVLEKYRGTNVPIEVNDKTCEHATWKARPHTLLKGIGCPECGRITAAKTRTRTQKEFEQEMGQISPQIRVVGEYKRSTERVSVLCRVCGLKWNPLAYSLLAGKGCPHCSAVRGAKKRKRNGEKEI